MKKTAIFISLLLFLMIPAVSADTSSSASQVYVVSYDIEPGVFMHGDTGTISVVVKNSGTTSAGIRRATIITKDFYLENEEAYATVGSIGPGVTKEFTFTIKAKGDGIYYPKFYLDFSSGGSLSYPVMVKVESSPLELSVSHKPDYFQKDVSDTVTLNVGNPRENTINGVLIRPSSEIADFKQSSVFVGGLEPNAYSEADFEVTPSADGEIRFIAEYRNGINLHQAEITLPVELKDGKKNAMPVVNNIEVNPSGSGYRISGDVTNAGLENAKSVVVTTKSPAVPADPNRLYVVGELEPDDFSGFDVDFTVDDADSVPLVINYKDEDGNDYSKTVDIKIRDSLTPVKTEGTDNTGDMPIGAIILIIIVAAAAGGAVYYSWKKQ